MVEIGAGGGSIAKVDALERIQVGPESAGADPGPACYDQGGLAPTVTDADVVLGRIQPEGFAGGSVTLAPEAAGDAVERAVGGSLNLTRSLAAFAVSEVVDENMANAARVHAIEWGKEVDRRAMIAFGGAAPLHAARLAEKLGLDQVVVPTGAGVGSAIGFLRAPVAYEVARSRYHRLSAFDPDFVNETLEEMSQEAYGIVDEAAGGAALGEVRTAYMRYLGQGHEITVELPKRALVDDDRNLLQSAFDDAYRTLYGRTIPDLDIEIMSWVVTVSTTVETPQRAFVPDTAPALPEAVGQGQLFDGETADYDPVPLYRRESLAPGMTVPGPALIIEDQTTTVVTRRFNALVNSLGYLMLVRRSAESA